MQQLLPDRVDSIDPYDAVRPADPRGRLVRLNVVTSIDGAVTDEQGRSGGLGGEGDKALFHALRAWADAILVGAGTVRAEGYGPHRLRPGLAARRAADGRGEPAAIVVVSRSLDVDYDGPLFRAARTPTTVLTCAAAPEDRQRAAADAGRLVIAGADEVDLVDGLRQLREAGMASVLCEGGPRLLQSLLHAHLGDELFLSLAPVLIGRDGPRMVRHLAERVRGELVGLLEQDSELYMRYRVQKSRSSPDSRPRSAS